jgi:addiction module HigA family antidote
MDRSRSKRLCKPKHPGLVLSTFIEPYGISQNSLARSMGVSPRRINEILQGKRAITADTAIGLAEVFGSGALFWMRLQARYDLAVARLLRQDRPPPALEVFRSEPWDECAMDSAEDDEYLAALRRGLKPRAATDPGKPRAPWLDDQDEYRFPTRRGARVGGRDESDSSRPRDQQEFPRPRDAWRDDVDEPDL